MYYPKTKQAMPQELPEGTQTSPAIVWRSVTWVPNPREFWSGTDRPDSLTEKKKKKGEHTATAHLEQLASLQKTCCARAKKEDGCFYFNFCICSLLYHHR
ncbi:hypothetical protein CDAR_435991 [Caerostris darwini]|uniref:Uncharacterized protein n=1 Tax=Caerostris darwini TaxID=1538125 RepID=A0AAV4SIU6_9ARAC|nr:hypothetical protein CDAR_435991 [Caerostris darwini]